MDEVRVAIHGAAGRMGRRLVALAAADPEIQIAAALEASGHERLGQDIGTIAGCETAGVALAESLEVPVDVVIDFSTAEAVGRILEVCRQQRIALVVATTGLDQAQQDALRRAGAEIPVLHSPNMSLAVNLTMKLAQETARALKDHDADVEILERHHRFKEDAPSGTALKFGRLIAEIMGQTLETHGRSGRPGPRPHDEIGYHAIRAGDHPGEHQIIFAMPGETIELVVRASSRDCYAAGALAAAKFLFGKPPGLYSMADVLGLA